MDSNVTHCELYLKEYIECKGLRGMFYHFYTFGHFHNKDCKQWKNDYENCISWCNSTKSENVPLGENEKKKIRSLYEKRTSIWSYRENPPEMWKNPGNLRGLPLLSLWLIRMKYCDIKQHILKKKLNKPTVFHNFTPTIAWSFSSMTFEKLAGILKDKKIKLRIGSHNSTIDVQWEGDCQFVYTTLEEFINWTDGKKPSGSLTSINYRTHWAYADYIYVKDLFDSIPNYDVFKEIKWSDLGFNEDEGQDMAIWMGSTGAHTLCHYDTYGYNIVVQICGRKRWILFPPSDFDNLYSTRIPYEESTVFSQVNILNPDLSKHPRFSSTHPHVVVLNPGDVLFVPTHWWHFVENLELSLSVNAWFASDVDCEQRVNEAITRMLIGCLMSHQSRDSFKPAIQNWLNPTASDVTNRGENLTLLENAVKAFAGTCSGCSQSPPSAAGEQDESNCTCCKVANSPLATVQCREVDRYCFKHACHKINHWHSLLDEFQYGSKSKRFRAETSDEDTILKTLARCVTKPSVIDCIKTEITKELQG